MPIQPPKTITSTEGLGVNTTKTMQVVDEGISIGVEVWNEMSEPWRQGETIIAEPGYSWVTKWETGKPYVITKFLDSDGTLIAVYCDVSRPIQKVADGFSSVDLYLDVWHIPGKDPVILDEDELTAAVRAHYISFTEAEEAKRVAESVIVRIKNDSGFLDF